MKKLLSGMCPNGGKKNITGKLLLKNLLDSKILQLIPTTWLTAEITVTSASSTHLPMPKKLNNSNQRYNIPD